MNFEPHEFLRRAVDLVAFVAYITGPDGVPRRVEALACDLAHARELVRAQGLAMFGLAFTYSVRAA